MAQGLGWRPTIAVMAVVLMVFSVVATIFLIRNTPADTGLRPYGAVPGEDGAARKEDPETLPGFTSRDAMPNPWFWLLSLSFVMIGMIVSVTQVLPILLNVYTGVNISVFSLLLATWTFTLIFWKPLLGIINDKIGVIWMMTITLGLMTLGFPYLPQMSSPAAGLSGAALLLPMLAMVFMSAGVSNATVAPPLVLRHTVGARDYSKLLSSLGLSFYYIGSALGAPLWGAIQTLTGTHNPGLYAAPVVLALIVIFSLLAGRNAPKSWTDKAPAKDVSPPTERPPRTGTQRRRPPSERIPGPDLSARSASASHPTTTPLSAPLATHVSARGGSAAQPCQRTGAEVRGAGQAPPEAARGDADHGAEHDGPGHSRGLVTQAREQCHEAAREQGARGVEGVPAEDGG